MMVNNPYFATHIKTYFILTYIYSKKAMFCDSLYTQMKQIYVYKTLHTSTIIQTNICEDSSSLWGFFYRRSSCLQQRGSCIYRLWKQADQLMDGVRALMLAPSWTRDVAESPGASRASRALPGLANGNTSRVIRVSRHGICFFPARFRPLAWKV